MTSEVASRGKAVQPHYGRKQANRLGSLPTGISSWINSAEMLNDTYGRLETEKERKAFFDEFLKRQRSGFAEAWLCIYQTVDLIRENDWYWKSEGFESFEAFWQEQGEALFGRWAELEATYQYAHLAAPHLFEVDFDEAKALAQQLAPFRSVPAAMSVAERNEQNGKKPKRNHALASLVTAADYVAELNGPEWQAGYTAGKNSKSGPGEDRFRRFARLRRDAPDVADRFLAGEFVKRFKNGTAQADMVAAEVAAGIRKEGQPARQRNGLAYARKLVSKFTREELMSLRNYIDNIMQSQP